MLLCSDTYADLHHDLQILCFPFDVFEGNIYYKLYSSYENIVSEDDAGEMEMDWNLKDDEDEIFNTDFNYTRVILMKNQIAELIKSNFDLLIELLYMTKHIAKFANSTIKSLLKLAFHYLLVNDYVKVVQILNDTIDLFRGEEFPDKVLFNQVKSIKAKVNHKLFSLVN